MPSTSEKTNINATHQLGVLNPLQTSDDIQNKILNKTTVWHVNNPVTAYNITIHEKASTSTNFAVDNIQQG